MKKGGITLKSRKEIEIMAESGKFLSELLQILADKVAPGVYGDELEEAAQQFIKKNKVVASFQNYCIDKNIMPFPSAICFSVNDEIVHGFPFGKLIKDGDIVSIDAGVKYEGFHSDSAITIGAGKISSVAKNLMDTTQQSLYAGIRQVAPGNRLGDIGNAIQSYAEAQGFSVVRDLVGHGVGRSIHESPEVLNYGRSNTGLKLYPGMVIAIEPMLNEGEYFIKVDDDDWTIRTEDGKLSAHFEHTIAVTEEGCQVLTLREGETIF
ncbi:MAG: type I methionyl aminopeptidase [Candidatus Paceibacterota bacterium]